MINKLIKNSTSNALVPVIRIGVVFFVTPVIVRALGNHDYGIWEIVISIIGYMGLLDLGLQPAIVHYVARYNALNDKEKLQKIYSSSLSFVSIMGAVSFLALSAWAIIGPEFLSEKGTVETKYILFLFIVAAHVFFIFPGEVFQSFHQGHHRYNLINVITIIMILTGSGFIMIFLLRGGGLLTLALIAIMGSVIKYIIYVIFLRLPGYGGYRFKKRYISRETLKELFTYSIKSLIQIIAIRISHATDSLVIGAYLGPAIVPFYIIPANLVQHARNLIWSMTNVFMPVFSDLNARGDITGRANVFIVASRYVVGITLPVICGIYFLGLPFLSRWIEPEYAKNGKWILYFIAGAFILPSLNPFSTRLLQGIGRHGILAKIQSLSAMANIMLSILLVQFWGKEGVALGTLIPSIILDPFILSVTCKHTNKTIAQYSYEVLWPLTIPLFIQIASLWLMSSYITLDTYLSVFGVGIISLIIYIPFFFYFSVEKEEQKFILHTLKTKFSRASL